MRSFSLRIRFGGVTADWLDKGNEGSGNEIGEKFSIFTNKHYMKKV